MYKKCEEILKELESEGKLKVWWNFKFPEKEPLKIVLKDLLEKEVDERYYLNDKQLISLKNSICARDFKDPKCIQVGELDIKGIDQIKRVYTPEGLSPTLTTMGGGNREPKIKIIGNYMPSNHNASRVVDVNGLAPTIKENHGTVTAIKKIDIPQIVKVRKYPIDTEKLKQVLRNAKVDNDISNEQLETILDIPITTIEHWFRKDNCFSIPSPDVWFKLKEILKISTDEFDKSIMTFEQREGIYEKANRCYLEDGLAPTLTTQEEKIITNYRIRKLTPLECWRLMGFDEEDFYKAQSTGNSNSQLYKQAGNSIVVKVLEKIFRNLLTSN